MAKYDENDNPYTWMPGFLRRFLNLTYDEQASDRSGSASSPSFASARSSATRATWSSPSEPTFTASSMKGYTPPAGGFTPPPAPAPRPSADGASTGSSLVGPPAQMEGIQPITYLLRAYARGALPPQGLEAFTKESRATSTDLWNLYTHWARFQTEEIFRFGRELLNAATDGTSTSSHSAAPARRIKVTVGNGNSHDTPAASAAPATSAVPVAPPIPSKPVTSATPPATPPAPTARTDDATMPTTAKVPDTATKAPRDVEDSTGGQKKS